MTYCVGLVLNEGLVLAADSRTNAGVHYVTTFSKLHVFTPAPDRIFILGGQIAGQPHGLMLIYTQGNYFAAPPETPYLQIGENKYGKPAVDRIAKPELSLADGARLCFVSLDATSRPNATVGPPFEVAIYPKDTLALSHHLKLDADSEELKAMSRAWNQGIYRAFEGLPRFAWEVSAKTAPSGPCD